MHTIKISIPGSLPEKDFVLQKVDGQVKQRQESKLWERTTKLLLQNETRGWTSQVDEEFGEYTPLQLIANVYTPSKTILVKQLKCLLDALSGVVYMDDSVVVDLIAERIESPEERVDLIIRPARSEFVSLPSGGCVSFDRYISSVQNSAWENGHPLDSEAHKADKQTRAFIRQQFRAQQEELIEGEFEICAVIGVKVLNKKTPLSLRNAARSFSLYPVMTPDADNLAYTLLTALRGQSYRNPEDCRRIRIVKNYWDPSMERCRVWLRNYEGLKNGSQS